MKKKSNNFLKVHINQTKVVSSSSVDSFTLKLKVLDQTTLTDKIGGKIYDYNKSFYFDIPQGKDSVPFEMVATSKTFLFLDSEVGKLSIPLNLARTKGKNEWYTLKNSSDEMFCMVLMAFSFEGTLPETAKTDLSAIEISKGNKYNVSCDNIKVNLNQSRINNSIDGIKVTNPVNLTHITGGVNMNNLSCFSRINDYQKPGDSSMISTNIIKSNANDLSNIIIQSNSFNNGQSISKNKKYDESNYISTLDSILEANEDGCNEKNSEEYYKECKKKLLHKYNQYKEEKEKLLKLEEEMKVTKEKLRQKESNLRKEKESLDEQIKSYKEEKASVDADTKRLNIQLVKLTEEETKAQIEKESFDRERSYFFTLNYYVNNSCNLDKKIEELTERFQKRYLVSKRPSFKKDDLTDLACGQSAGSSNILKQNNSSQNFNLSSKILEENNNINNSNASESGRPKQSKSESKNIFKISINQHLFSSNHNSASRDRSHDPDSSVRNLIMKHDSSPFSAVHKSQSTAIIQSKFYPPIAEINLGANKIENNSSASNGDLNSSKIKLTDSLDNITPKKILKHSGSKIARGGSEENKKNDLPPKDGTKKIVLNVNLSNKKISPKLEKPKKDNSAGSQSSQPANPTNLVSHRVDKNVGTKINLRKLK